MDNFWVFAWDAIDQANSNGNLLFYWTWSCVCAFCIHIVARCETSGTISVFVIVEPCMRCIRDSHLSVHMCLVRCVDLVFDGAGYRHCILSESWLCLRWDIHLILIYQKAPARRGISNRPTLTGNHVIAIHWVCVLWNTSKCKIRVKIGICSEL